MGKLINEKRKLKEVILKVEAENKVLKNKALKDPLTKLFNRWKIEEFFSERFQLFKEEKEDTSFIMLDIDNFKHVNDLHGHSIGDETIIAVTKGIKSIIREKDKAFRLGGDEFLIGLTNVDMKLAGEIAERIKQVISNENINQENSDDMITCSFGISMFLEKDLDYKEAINRADRALYISKNKGKNRVTVFDKAAYTDMEND